MTDNLTPSTRRRCMSHIRSKNTVPEKVVRSIVYSLGYRYRLHKKDLPGKPDLVLARRRKLIFVHGCFWHMHDCPRGRVVPKTNVEYWQTKRKGNVVRDHQHVGELSAMGWKVLVVWECQIKHTGSLREKISKFLED